MAIEVFHQCDLMLCVSGAIALGSDMAGISLLLFKDFMHFFLLLNRFTVD